MTTVALYSIFNYIGNYYCLQNFTTVIFLRLESRGYNPLYVSQMIIKFSCCFFLRDFILKKTLFEILQY